MLLGLTVAVFFRPAYALGGIVAMFVFEQMAQQHVTFFVAHEKAMNLAFMGLLGLALVISVVRGKPVFRGHPAAMWLMIALYGFALVSVLWSINRTYTVALWQKNWAYLLVQLVLAPIVVTDLKDLRDAMYSTLVLGTISLVGIIISPDWHGRAVQLTAGAGIGSVVGLTGNPLAVASLGGYVAIAAALMHFTGVARIWQVMRWGVVALGLAAAIKSGSRGQLFAILIAVVVFLPVSRRFGSLRGVVGTAFAIIALAALALVAHSQFAQSNRWEWNTMVSDYETGRIAFASDALRFWSNTNPFHWVFGIGSSACFDERVVGFYPHLVMAEVLVEEGFIGLVLLWMVPLVTFLSAKRCYALVREFPEARGLVAATAAMFLFDVIISFKSGSLHGSGSAFMYAIMLGRAEVGLRRFHEAQMTQVWTPPVVAQSLPPVIPAQA